MSDPCENLSVVYNQSVFSDDRDSFLQSAFDSRKKSDEFKYREPIVCHGNARKQSESISRYVEQPCDPYEIPWQATFMSRVTQDLLFVRSKYNLLDLIDSRTLKYV